MAEPIVVTSSGGLDTPWCVPWLAETTGRPVITVGGITIKGYDGKEVVVEARARAGRAPAASEGMRRILMTSTGLTAASAGRERRCRRGASSPPITTTCCASSPA